MNSITAHQPPSVRPTLWWRWLVAADLGVLLFGLGMVVAPGFTRRFFGLLLLARPDAIDAFGPAAVAYITLLHAVLGAVMIGWSVALLLVLFGPFRDGARAGWLAIAISVTAWFVPDTLFSLWSGFWQNAAFNLLFAALFALPLAATRYDFFGPGR